MKNKEKQKFQLKAPPRGNTFVQLLNFIWDHGLGRRTGKGSWTVPDMEAALMGQVSFAAVESWFQKSSSLHSRPLIKKENLRLLAQVISAGDQYQYDIWIKKLLLERGEEGILRSQLKKKANERARLEVGAYVEKIWFCDEKNFNKDKGYCKRPLKYFPYGIKTIFVSFGFMNMDYQQTFRRRWYHNGEKWKDIEEDYYDEAWPGYTFIRNRKGHSPGEHTLRITVADKNKTAKFIVKHKGE